MGSCANTLHGLKPALLMVLVQSIFAIVNIGYKLASNDGMNLSILVGYRFLFGAAFMVPLAYFVERKRRPKLTLKTVGYTFLCGLFGGALGQNLYLKGLVLTSATFASAMTNLIPAITFIIALCLRLERLGWKTAAGKAKMLGTVMGISGAMLLTFYKGPVLNLWDTHVNLLETTMSHHHNHLASGSHGHNLVLGSILALAGCVCYSLWLIIQAKASEEYPCPYSITAMMSVWGSIQSVFFALCTERDWSQWILGWNIRLLTVAFTGIFGSGLMFTLVAWCVKMGGPLFVSVFNPLLLIIVAIAGSLFLEEKLHVGMLLGAILIIFGLYVVLWGKGKEMIRIAQLMPENDIEQQTYIDSAPQPTPNGSSHGRGNKKEVGMEIEEERRDSFASTEALGGAYVHL